MLVTNKNIYFEKQLYDNLMLLKMASIKYDMSFVVAIDGRERTGKSTIASQSAYVLDDSIDLDRVAFNVKQFKEATLKARSLGKGKVVVLDEGGNIFSADDTAQRQAKQIKKIVMMNGKYNIIYLICVPSIFDLSPYMRIHRIDWLLRVNKEVRKDDKDEWEFNKGAYACYSYDQKTRLLMMARYKYDYSACKPMFRGRFLNTVKTTDIYGEAYEDKKDKAIEDAFSDTKDVDIREEVAKALMRFRGKKLNAELIGKALGYKSGRNVYRLNAIEREDKKEVMGMAEGTLGVSKLPEDEEE